MTIDPPLTPTEKPIALTIRKGGLVLTPIGTRAVHIENNSETYVPLFFYVGIRDAPLSKTIAFEFIRAFLKGTS